MGMTRLKILALAGLLACGLSGAGQAAECFSQTHQANDYTVCKVDPAQEELRLFRAQPDGQVLGSFNRVNDLLAPDGHALGFAMNAGMYHRDRAPVGLYIEDGQEQARIVSRAGPGNFGLLPNGVFCVTDSGGAQVIETLAYVADPPACRHATQSGPMLVIDGALHPRFLKDGTSRYIRNGVGVRADGQVFFAISDQPVTFYEFGGLFRDVLNTPNALYFDGNVSRLYAPQVGRDDAGFPMGPIIGTVTPQTR